MKNLRCASGKLVGMSFLLSVFSAVVYAQKLPNVQQTSIKAPANVKTDGTATEWDKLQAYNKSTSLFYTIANTTDKLYLTIQATDQAAIDKILAGGITFTITSADKSNKALPVMFTFPIVSGKDRSSILHKIKDPEVKIDEELTTINTQLTTASKEIEVTGIAAITDTLISVYNDQGIKAAALFDSKRAYTYELSVPLKYLQKVITSSNTFNYNIKLNGLKMGAMTIQINGKSVNANSPEAAELMSTLATSGNLSSATQDASGKVTINSGSNPMQNLLSPTDLSGSYTLAK